MVRLFLAFAMFVVITLSAAAQTPVFDRSVTGGAQTLEDIIARQNGEVVADGFRRNATGDPGLAADGAQQLGTLGGISDPELWRALRYGSANVTVSAGGDVAQVLVQDGGMRWLLMRQGPVATYTAYGLGGIIALLIVFYLIRGRIRLDGEVTGRTITRFKAVERFAHWVLAGSFILLGVTGLYSLFGRTVLIPLFGKESFATIAMVSKWVHNNVSWAFMIALVMIFVMWVVHNIPDRTDLKWLAMGGGIFKKGVHPPAKKFNAGQKLIFWAVIVLGASISASGLSLLFPFELPMFAATFVKLNALGIPEMFGIEPFRTALAPQEEMQLSQLRHTVVSSGLMIVIIAHIYIGSVGMEGAYDAMSTGEVEEQWAREHHVLWLKEVEEIEALKTKAAPIAGE
ncbi:MAG: formate dehydrogenase subunit gamma [Paracoccaceae bacterium]|nr:formate dehydrogenase subunit gamma [Paracoccaceae bacterium]